MADTCWIGIDIGGTNLRIGAIGRENEVTAFEKRSTPQIFYSMDAGGELVRLIRDFIGAYGLEGVVKGICVGVPATLNRERTVVLQAPNIRGLDGRNVVGLLRETFGVPVWLMKDVCTALFYDREKYHVPQCELLLGIYIGTGIGNIICVNGKELIGRDGVAGELGHIPLTGSSELCGCGNTGCAEVTAGGMYLARLCETIFTPLPVSEIFNEKRNHPLILQYLERLAGIIATEINILNPDYVILGGGVPAMKGFPMEILLERIRSHTRKPYPEQGLQIIVAEDDEKKGVTGAVLYAKSRQDKRE